MKFNSNQITVNELSKKVLGSALVYAINEMDEPELAVEVEGMRTKINYHLNIDFQLDSLSANILLIGLSSTLAGLLGGFIGWLL
ncbi:MAG: hypothetical protein AAF639_01055 [Chloroflexota bacterium]